MQLTIEEIEEKILNLPIKDRARLAERLIASLEIIEDQRVEHLWLIEAEKRLKEYRAGNIDSRPAQEALHEALKKIS
ncbi:addiction module protein [candidate division CSSED10-310 bacterium]|uniref:Addiction module protein n=1 Tax=candidate division CSSED10-310 bacterium TaxID=2855610 RepID=A0ABV6YST7_UNCC1